jgi:hypothetical protein
MASPTQNLVRQQQMNNNKKLGIVVLLCPPSYVEGVWRRVMVQVSLAKSVRLEK